ncbi:MAG: NAD(P)H-dependent oxidoreductase subunit E [Halanaerobiales bacterium]|nr:NAD(P)H-dependent oxidoreductase subunit E [Halanaerobiales bacterium]
MKKCTVEICVGTPCHLMGAQDLLSAVQSISKAQLELIHLKTVPCLKSCENSPAVRINGEICAPMTPDELIQKITALLEV